jgi:ATPase family AAA domain-containing protein 1
MFPNTQPLPLHRLSATNKLTFDTKTFNEHELMIASHLVVPEDISVSWRDIAGLDSVVQELKESVVMPVKNRAMFANSQLYQAPKGVLLHGPPGCGEFRG